MNAKDLLVLGLDDDDMMVLTGDDDEAGAVSPRARRGKALKRALITETPGAPAQQAKFWPLGFTVVSFTALSGTALTATAAPQRPFKGNRLVIDIARTGATATGLVTLTQLLVGQTNQLVSAQPVGAGAFAAGAFDVALALTSCEPGIVLSAGLAISAAPAAADRVDIATTLIGLAYG